MSVAMEIPDVPSAAACARCGALKLSGQPCPRCGTTANRPHRARLARAYAEGIGIVLLILAFSVAAYWATIEFALWFWSGI